MPIKLLIADDHALLRQGIKNVLELEPDLQVVGEAATGPETIKLSAALKPDVVLLDINMPQASGLEVTRAIRANQPDVKILILTIHDDENYIIDVLKAGAAGYLLKDIEPGMLVKAIRTVYEGESFIYPTLAKRLLGEFRRSAERKSEAAEAMQRLREHLTYREIEVLQLISQGLSNAEVAGKLYLSEKTVKNHLTNIFRKLNVSDRTQAVLYAIKHKIVTLD
mgnify:CR=1 FL=1